MNWNPFKKEKKVDVAVVTAEIKVHLDYLERGFDRLLDEFYRMKEALKTTETIEYKGQKYPVRYVDVTYTHEDGDDEINTYTVIDTKFGNKILNDLKNGDYEAEMWDEDLFWMVSTYRLKHDKDEELIEDIQSMNC